MTDGDLRDQRLSISPLGGSTDKPKWPPRTRRCFGPWLIECRRRLGGGDKAATLLPPSHFFPTLWL